MYLLNHIIANSLTTGLMIASGTNSQSYRPSDSKKTYVFNLMRTTRFWNGLYRVRSNLKDRKDKNNVGGNKSKRRKQNSHKMETSLIILIWVGVYVGMILCNFIYLYWF